MATKQWSTRYKQCRMGSSCARLGRKHRAHGLCTVHYDKARAEGKIGMYARTARFKGGKGTAAYRAKDAARKRVERARRATVLTPLLPAHEQLVITPTPVAELTGTIQPVRMEKDGDFWSMRVSPGTKLYALASDGERVKLEEVTTRRFLVVAE